VVERRSRRSPPITPSTLRWVPIQVSEWKRQLLEGASEQITRRKKSMDKDEGPAKEA